MSGSAVSYNRMACEKAKLKDYIQGRPDPAQALKNILGDHAIMEDLDCSNHEHDDDTLSSEGGNDIPSIDAFGEVTSSESKTNELSDNDGIPKLVISNLWNNPIAVHCIRHRADHVRAHRLLQLLMDPIIPLTNPIPAEHITKHEESRKNAERVEPSDLMKARIKEVGQLNRDASDIQRLDIGSINTDDSDGFFTGFEQVGL